MSIKIHYATDVQQAETLLKPLADVDRVGVDCEFRPHPDFISDDWRMILAKGDDVARKKLIDSDEFKAVSFDPFRNQLTLWQIGYQENGQDMAVLLNVQAIGQECLAKLLKPYLTNPHRIYIGQNLLVEYVQALHKFHFRLGGISGHTLRDVMLREKVLYSGQQEEVPAYATINGVEQQTGTKRVPIRFGLGPMRARRLGYDRRLALEEKEGLRLTFTYTDTEDGFDASQLDYGARDAIDPMHIYDQQEAEFDAEVRGVDLRTVAQWEDECIPVVGDMQLRGMSVDVAKWNDLADESEAKTKQYYDDLQRLCLPRAYKDLVGNLAGEINLAHIKMVDPASPMDLLRALHDLGLQTITLKDPSDPKGKRKKVYTLDDTKAGTLVNFRRAFMLRYGRDDCAPLDLVINWREWDQRRKSFGREWTRKYINPVTGRVHSSKNQYGAKSGRFSDSNPNLQQIPSRGPFAARYRSCFVARPDHKLITVDWSQIELRIIAALSGDPLMLEVFRTNKDLHTKTCSEMLKYAYEYIDTIKKDKTHPEHDRVSGIRTSAKTLNFGVSYGMGETALSIKTAEADEVRGMGLLQRCARTKQEVEAGDRCTDCARCALATWRESYATAWAYLVQKSEDVMVYLKAEDLAGGRRFFSLPDPVRARETVMEDQPNLTGFELENAIQEQLRSEEAAMKLEGRNHGIQGLNARMLKKAMRRVWNDIRPYRAYITNVVHDEILVEAPCSCGQLDQDACQPDCTTQAVAKIVIDTMEAVAQEFLGFADIPTPAEGNISRTWSK